MIHDEIQIRDDGPLEKRVFLTLDFECDYGTALEQNSYDSARATENLVDLLESYDVPLSCFLQTELLTAVPEAVNELEAAEVPVEMHAHSHTHPPRGAADVEFEVQESVTRVRDQFRTSPLGFRFPDGAMGSADYQVLAANDIAFSSSVFPSVRPGRFNNLDQPCRPYLHQPSGVVELPFTVLSKYVPVPVALSYLKLLGSPFKQLVNLRPPSTIIFDFHMHDLVVPPAFEELPSRYQRIYRRNKRRGFDILSAFIQTLQSKGYTFEAISTLYEEVADSLS